MTQKPLTGIADLESALERSGLDPAAHRELLERLRRFLNRYATLERELLGGILIAVPRHLLEDIDEERPEDIVENLATRERERLDVAGQGGRDLRTLLDHEGLKVYRPPFPPGTRLQGLFLFDEAIGPAFVVDGRLPHAAANAVFAQLYGHYLLDHDPYQIQLVLAGGASQSPRALRGRHFAVAFLVGRSELTSYLQALGWKPEDPVTRDLLDHLAVYFEVDTATVAARLLSLGLLDAPAVVDLDLRRRAVRSAGDTAVPDRLVRLALEAHARHRLTANELAEHLETDVRSALRLAGQFAAPELDSTSPES